MYLQARPARFPKYTTACDLHCIVLFLFLSLFLLPLYRRLCVTLQMTKKKERLCDTEIFGPMFYVDSALVSLVQDESQVLTLGGALIFQFQLWQITDRFR